MNFLLFSQSIFFKDVTFNNTVGKSYTVVKVIKFFSWSLTLAFILRFATWKLVQVEDPDWSSLEAWPGESCLIGLTCSDVIELHLDRVARLKVSCADCHVWLYMYSGGFVRQEYTYKLGWVICSFCLSQSCLCLAGITWGVYSKQKQDKAGSEMSVSAHSMLLAKQIQSQNFYKTLWTIYFLKIRQ